MAQASASMQELADRFGFTAQEVEQYKKHFDQFDNNGDGHIDANELAEILKQIGIYQGLEQLSDLIAEVDENQSNTIEFNEFLKVLQGLRSGKKTVDKGFAKVMEEHKKLVQVKGMSGVHSFAQEEMSAFAEHFNQCLGHDADLDYLMPIDPSGNELCEKIHDGMLLAKFINLAVHDTIDERALNKKRNKLSTFEINENLNLVISSAKSIGVQTVNIGATELANGAQYPHLVLGVIWQLVKLQLLNQINLTQHPELYRLLEQDETLADLLKLPPEQLLLRWFNYHLKNANHPKRVTNFAGDVKDSEAYTVLLSHIAPNTCDRAALGENDQLKRAQMVLGNAHRLNVPTIITPSDIVKGNSRLNLAFTASIFNTCPGLEPLTEEEKKEMAGMMTDDVGDSREERAFRMWINSMGIQDLYINNLFEDCKDGLVLLKVLEHIEPGVVAWARVEKKPNNKFKKISNCNYVVLLGKQLKFSLVGIQGTDIVDGNKKLLLALVWQMMRLHTMKFLAQVKLGGRPVDDAMIVEWANKKVQEAGRSSSMSNFKDKTLADGKFFVDLLSAVEPQIVNWDLVTAGDTPENKLLNARYAISIARKLGCVIFLLPEDIVEVNPKMIMTFVAAIMAISKN